MPMNPYVISWAMCFAWFITATASHAQTVLEITELHRLKDGRVQVSVVSSPEHYYVLSYNHEGLQAEDWKPVSIAFGDDAGTTLSDLVRTGPTHGYYRVEEYRRDDPADLDGDGLDDVTEMLDPRTLNPLNPAKVLDFSDGTSLVKDKATFREMSYKGLDVSRDRHLEDLEFVKFMFHNTHAGQPELYFLNTETHRVHFRFMDAVNIPRQNSRQMRGEIIFHPHLEGPKGKLGVYRYEFEPNDNYPFEEVEWTYEMLASAMPFLKDNLRYYPMPGSIARYRREKALYDQSRVQILLEEDLFGELGFLALNFAESYGRLRLMELDERPTSRDVVIYRGLPNELPRVAGIITEVTQTPLSHVNLRAVQDKLPNAFISEASQNPDIAALIGKNVYYAVSDEGYEIREASQEEVNAHFEAIRPTEAQVPERDLSQTEIRPLKVIAFEDSSKFGVKAANLAELHSLGFPESAVPDGFGIPFYFYDAFMKHNGLYAEAEALLNDADFQSSNDVQDDALKVLRDQIKDANMPTWMLNALTDIQQSFPEGSSIRCRSSTNNEDLPGFSGAGLYDSFTHHPDEGHLSKSIKQVFASLWNFRAFQERDFYRIDHFAAVMGVLVHQNFSGEQANGVAVTTDPFYQSEKKTFYINTQVGEDLVTNPEDQSVPEEMLIDAVDDRKVSIVRNSNRALDDEQILSRSDLSDLHLVLRRIDSHFRTKYGVFPWTPGFAMEIEFKITEDGFLSIKQARPWVF